MSISAPKTMAGAADGKPPGGCNLPRFLLK